ncbi:MAG: MBL fold metallo-hydrolase [Acidobacteriota bacterium]|nr:MBL fold metallo-hydrolase [Acidobacteriota bacterium]
MQQLTRGVVTALAIALAGAAFGATDAIPAAGGAIEITPLYHASLQIAYGGTVIQVDPTKEGNAFGPAKADLILVTDIHGDHFQPPALEAVKKAETPVVAPQVVADKLPGALVMRNGDTRTVAGIEIHALPMYNLHRGPAPGQLYHPKGRGNGYILTLGGKRIYIAGDTACTPEMKAVRNIDVAFVPMNLPYTMTPAEAAACVKVFHPKIVYPYHYRGSDLKVFADALQGTGIDVRLRDWYRTAPGR